MLRVTFQRGTIDSKGNSGPVIGSPFFGLHRAKADDLPPASARGVDENGPGSEHLFPCCPKRCRPHSSVSEGWEGRAVLRHRRRVGRAELPSRAPAFPESRLPERCVHSRLARCSSEADLSAFRCRPARDLCLHVAVEYGLRLSWQVLLHGLVSVAKTKQERAGCST